MGAAGARDHDVQAEGLERGAEAPDLRLLGVGEVDRDEAAHRRTALVHQAGGLAEEDILRVLAALRARHGVDAVLVVEAVEDGGDQHLEGRRRGQAAARGDVARRVGVEAADGEAAGAEGRRDAADQGGGAVALLLLGLELRQVDDVDARVALGLEPDDVVVVGAGDGDDVLVDRGADDLAALVVRVVAADLGAPRRGEEVDVLGRRIEVAEQVDEAEEALGALWPRRLIGVEAGEGGLPLSLTQTVADGRDLHNSLHSLRGQGPFIIMALFVRWTELTDGRA